MVSFAQSLLIESWCMWGFGVLLIAARIASRTITEGSILRIWPEEYIMIFVLGVFTADSWAIPEIAIHGSNYISHAEAVALTPPQVKSHVYGSIMTLVVEVLTLTTLWSCKACLCLMFYRLTMNRHAEHIFVKCIAVYCFVAYFLVLSMFLAYWCRPFSDYWAIPVPPHHSQCATYYHHMIFATAFNILADLALLSIPLRLIPKLQIPLKRKAVLVAVLSLGVFNILAAILNRAFNWAYPDSLEYTRWYVGEVATSVYVVNIPACWPVLRKIFRLNRWSDEPSTDDVRPSFIYGNPRSRNTKPNAMSMIHSAGASGSEEMLADIDGHGRDLSDGLVPTWATGTHYSSTEGTGDAKGMDPDGIVRTVEVSQYAESQGRSL